jgi:D-alanine-D-alanine ligase-like ATP-grasp enzyme
MDKAQMRAVFAYAGLPQPRYAVLSGDETRSPSNYVLRDLERTVGYPCFVKPANGGSSLGVSKASTREDLLEGFRTCFESLDALYILGTFAARETAEAGIDARALAAEITKPRPVYVETFEKATERIAAELQPGDVFFTIGAGDVERLGPMVKARMEAES